MTKLKRIVILNCYLRKQEGLVLKKTIESCTKIPVEIAYDDGTYSDNVLERMWNNIVSGLKTTETEGFILMIHDDMLFSRNVFDKIEYILNFMPNEFVSFFNPDNKDYRTAHSIGHRILKTKINFWLPAFCYPVKLIKEFIEFGSNINFSGKSDDYITRAFCKSHGINVFAIVPSLFQHLGPYRSALGNSGQVGKNIRFSLLYKPESNSKIDWIKELNKPFIIP